MLCARSECVFLLVTVVRRELSDNNWIIKQSANKQADQDECGATASFQAFKSKVTKPLAKADVKLIPGQTKMCCCKLNNCAF